MYEFTHGGLWFDWDALDPVSKRLAGGSMVAASVAGVMLGIMFSSHQGNVFFDLGYWVAGGRGPAGPRHPLVPHAWTAFGSLVLLVISGVLWWRFSLRQDEMFNRVQNWALGMSGAVTSAVLAGWALLALGGIVGPVSPLPLVVGFWGAVMVCWLIAVRRWA